MSNQKDYNLNTYEWEVEDIESFKRAKNVEEVKSPFFELHGLNWCLRVFPNGSTKAKKDNVNCFLWLRSLPPKYSKIAVNITLILKELNIRASFPHQYTDKAVTRGWVTGTLATTDIQSLESITFMVEIVVHDIYGVSGKLEEKTATNDDMLDMLPMLNKQSSALILDKQNRNDSRLVSLSLKIEELLIKIENIQNGMDNISDKQNENDQNIDSIVNEIKNIKQKLKVANECKTDIDDDIILNQQNTKVKIWLENECQMPQYFKLFIQNGAEKIEIVKLLNIDHLQKMGIDKIGHRVHIAHKIEVLKQKIEEK